MQTNDPFARPSHVKSSDGAWRPRHPHRTLRFQDHRRISRRPRLAVRYICAARITVEGAARLSLCDSDVSCASAAANRSVSERNALVTKTVNPPSVATDGLNMQQMLNASENTASER